MRRNAGLDVLLVVLSAVAVYLMRRAYSVAAIAYMSVVILQIAFDDQRREAQEKTLPSVHAATVFLVDLLVQVTCSLFACGVLVLFNHEEVIL